MTAIEAATTSKHRSEERRHDLRWVNEQCCEDAPLGYRQ